MAGTIVVDRLESDASYASSINIASPIVISNTATITGNVNFDSATLFVDAVNNRVGIGTQNPVVGLQVTNPSGGGQIRVVSNGGNILQLISDSTEASIRAVAGVPLTFRTSNEERLRIPSDAAGITFPAAQAASSDPNTLDDYEEGTWTPVITNGTTGVTSYYWQSGLYRKIGNLVWIEVQISVNVVGISSGNIKITGLPFPLAQKSGLGTQSKTIIHGTKYAGSPSGAISMIIESSSPSEMFPHLTSDISTQLSHTSLASGGQWHFQGSYITTS